jgi:hypothetical protein
MERIWSVPVFCLIVQLSEFREVARSCRHFSPIPSQVPINAEAGCAVKALVHSGGIPARELVRSTR